MKLIHVVADYGPGDLAFSELMSAIAHYLEDNFYLHSTPVSSFDTIGTGFCIAQLALQQESLRPKEMIVFANCAPRKDRREERKNNDGESLLYGVLNNSVPILVVNSGYSLSFVRDNLELLRAVNVPTEGSQFRSRDIFPGVVGMIARGETEEFGQELDPLEVIPPMPRGVVAYCDSFGNLKTTFRSEDPEMASLKEGQEIRLRINHQTHSARVATGSFNVREGEIAFAPGSSGHGSRFWEVFKRGYSAESTFDNPAPGASVEILREKDDQTSSTTGLGR